ncbi:MAG: sulfatase-like hydrolase/transferase [Flavobacteriaceae bacterium]|nr:sulfatase-like hydrolase/transferase [Flavobacteriaceae bacterium]
MAAPHTPWVPSANYKGKSLVGMYGEFVQMVDDQVGHLLKYLEDQGISEETLVVFTSDNGPYWKPHHKEKYEHLAAAHLRGMKGDIYEAGHRVPFIVKWPGKIPSSSISQQQNSLANFYATIADLLEKPSEALDSHSILDALTQKENILVPKPIVHHSSQGHFALRYGDWKFIEKRGSGGFTPPVTDHTPDGERQERLFNLKEDPSEEVDLALKFPQKLDQMKQKLDSIRQLNPISIR